MSDKITQVNRLIDQGRLPQAEALLMPLLAKVPGDVSLNSLMGYLAARLGKRDRALYYSERAFRARPEMALLRNNYSEALCALGRVREGIDVLLAAIESPGLDAAGYLGLTDALSRVSDYPAALRYADEGLARHPGAVRVACNRAYALQWLGRAQEGLTAWRHARDLDPTDLVAASGTLSCTNYVEGIAPEQSIADQRAFAAAVSHRFGRPSDSWLVDRTPERRLRVAILSPDMRRHAVSYFTEALLKAYDRQEWSLWCYATGNEDDRSAELRQYFDTWRSEKLTSPEALATKIRNDRIDVLIDLAGHTIGGRLETLHLRPSPVQISGIGYPGSTGLSSVGWRITDQYVDPPDEPWACAETPLRLEPCFQCYTPQADAPKPALATGTPEGAPMFGTFSAPQKWSDSTVRLWAGVLRAVPGSRLLIKNLGLASQEARTWITRRLIESGANAESLIVEGPVPTPREVLDQYARVDISVDTFPYHGTTTACESLWMGVPIIVLAGRTSAARVGCSVLANIGLSELIAHTPEEYVGIARRLAAVRERLREWRSGGSEGLRARMAASPLCDGADYAGRLQKAVRNLWRDWCATGNSRENTKYPS